jgi:hypothetical protein
VIKAVQEVIHHGFDCFEIHHHVIVIERLCNKDQLNSPSMAVRKTAITWVLGKHMTAFNFDRFADTEHGGAHIA